MRYHTRTYMHKHTHIYRLIRIIPQCEIRNDQNQIEFYFSSSAFVTDVDITPYFFLTIIISYIFTIIIVSYFFIIIIVSYFFLVIYSLLVLYLIYYLLILYLIYFLLLIPYYHYILFLPYLLFIPYYSSLIIIISYFFLISLFLISFLLLARLLHDYQRSFQTIFTRTLIICSIYNDFKSNKYFFCSPLKQ